MLQSIAISKKIAAEYLQLMNFNTTVPIAAVAEKTDSSEICLKRIILPVSLISLMIRMP